ncbi:AzlD domain-containing protein [Actinophytocola sp.]|uniref:AzlD domain-containing protein n=1 Tax=Actinophytocola sp. TaxID=1872138 RepID=UPI0039C8AE5D
MAARTGAAGGGRVAGGGTDVAVLPPRVTELMSTAATVLLVALIATAALTAGGAFAGVALPAGVLTGGVLAWRRVPFVVVVVVAAAVAAGLRALGVP